MSVSRTNGLVVIPALNEESSIGAVVSEIRSARPDLDILVVDDGSRDATAKYAQSAGATVLQLPFNLGVGGAMRTGFRYAQMKNYHHVIQVDADGQHDIAFIGTLEEPLSRVDLVVGNRFGGQGTYKVTGPRRWVMRLLAITLSAICGARLTDTTSGFRCSGPRAISLFALTYPSEYLGDTIESLVIGHRAGLSIEEVPVRMRERYVGRSSASPFRATLYVGRALLILLVSVSHPSARDSQART